jgi:hypothetical protein
MTPTIAFERYPARRGAKWLRDAYAMLSVHRLRWLALLVMYYAVFALIELIPQIGRHVAFALKPVFDVGFLAAAWAQERGDAPHARHLFQGFRANLKVLVALGIVLVAGISIAVFATALVDGGALLGVLEQRTSADDPNLPIERMQLAMLFGALCTVPLLLALWFAPALVVFQDCGTLRSLSVSLAAAFANWRPILVYAMLVFFFLGVVPGMLVAIVRLFMPSYFALIAVMPYILLALATRHISDYVCYRDIFHPKETPERSAGGARTPPS